MSWRRGTSMRAINLRGVCGLTKPTFFWRVFDSKVLDHGGTYHMMLPCGLSQECHNTPQKPPILVGIAVRKSNHLSWRYI